MLGPKSSISIRVAVLTVLVGSIANAAALFAMYSHYADQAREAIQLKSQAITHSLDAAAAILGVSPELVRIVHALGAEEGVRNIHVLDDVSGQVFASTENSVVGTDGRQLLRDTPKGVGSERSRTSRRGFVGDSYRISLPITIRGASAELMAGVILLEMDASTVHADALRGMSHPAGIMLLGGIVMLTTILFVLHRMVFRPLKSVQLAMRNFKRGDASARVPPLGANAIGALGDQLNRLFEAVCIGKAGVERTQLELIAARDQAERATRLKSEFLASMSHEIRTPLNAIMGMAQMLTSSKLPDKQARYARIVLDSGGMLLALIDDILDFSRIEAGKVTVERAPFSLHKVLTDGVAMLAPRAREKSLDLVLGVEADVPDLVNGDAHRFRQVVLNLVGNGVKFTSGGAVGVSVRLVEGLTAGRAQIRVEVRDTGIGIAQEAQGKLFQKFSQADASTTRRFGGSGLGLAICYQLVALMGGRIGVESRLGAGSTFWFEVPLHEADGEGWRSVEPVRLQSHAGADPKVLVVDDQEVCAQAAQSMVSSAGGRCEWAPDVETALEQLAQAAAGNAPYDVVLLDKRLAQDAGAAALLQEADRGIVPVILWAGDTDQIENALKAHPSVQDCVSRIAGPGRLLESMQAALRSTGPVRAALATGAKAAPALRGKANDLRGMAVIIADDLESHRMVLREFLEQQGCSVGIAEDGRGAVELRATGGYDAIIMDCHMPVMDGFQATGQIREMEREFGWTAIPIIALSGHVASRDRERCLKAGMNAHLAKPIDLNALKDAILAEACGASAGQITHDSRVAEGLAEAAPKPSAVPSGETLFANPSILVAEDCEVNGEVATALLEMMGCNVTIARNGKVALELCAKDVFDLVLLDVQMPEMDGFEAAASLRRMMAEGRMRKVPIIAFTANALKGDRERCVAAGMDDYIEKPIDQRVMAAKLQEWLPPRFHARGSSEAWVPVDEATLNPAALRAVRNMMKGRFESYVRMFIRETRRQLDLIHGAVSGGGTASDVAKASGALRLSCSQIGASRLSYVAGIVEDMAVESQSHGGELSGLGTQADRMETLFTELELEIQRYLRTGWGQMAS